jgi:hypothetical protein
MDHKTQAELRGAVEISQLSRTMWRLLMAGLVEQDPEIYLCRLAG